VELGLVKILFAEHVHADALTGRRCGGSLQGEAMMPALLDTAEIDRVRVFVTNDEPDHLDVEIAAGREIVCRQDQMACTRDIERRIEVRAWNCHRPSYWVSSFGVRRS
jgi:hypothetical protein